MIFYHILVFSKCFARLCNLTNPCMWWLEDYHTVLKVNVWFILGVCVQCISWQIYFYINSWKISFIKTQKHAFADLFGSHLTITNRFGRFAIWQTSFRKKLEYLWSFSLCIGFHNQFHEVLGHVFMIITEHRACTSGFLKCVSADGNLTKARSQRNFV